ncbi:MAG: response regulator [Firmicutes bacterium]|nr:response regulator [Bacillota bacterium]MCL5040849.1 response regulator [Bacillota bacterium]
MARVMVVDDADFMRMRLSRLLGENGYEILEAENGSVAVRKYQEFKPDVVLMDITMPIMDGLTAVKEIKKLDPTARIIMCTALGQQTMVIEAIKAGARDFVVKPFQPEKVLNAVKKVLG